MTGGRKTDEDGVEAGLVERHVQLLALIVRHERIGAAARALSGHDWIAQPTRRDSGDVSLSWQLGGVHFFNAQVSIDRKSVGG